MASEGCGLRDLPGNEIYLGLQSNGCRQTPSRDSTRLTVPNRILPQNALLENEYTIVKKYQPPNEPIGPQLRFLPKCFLNFTYFCGFCLNFFLFGKHLLGTDATVGTSVETIYIHINTHAAHLALGRAPWVQGSGAIRHIAR